MKEINRNIARNIKNYLYLSQKEPSDLAKELECATSTVYTWLQGNSTPRMDKIDRMCILFGCEREDLISETTASPEDAMQKQIILAFERKFRELEPEFQLRIVAYMEALIKLQKEKEDHNDKKI